MRLIITAILLVFAFSCASQKQKIEIPEEEVPAHLLQAGNEYYQNNEFENAFRAYGNIYHSYPTSREYIDAAIGLSRCYGKLENYEKEFDILYSLLRENLIPSKVPDVYNAIAEFYEESAGISEQLTGEGSGDYLTAIAYYDKSIKYPNSEDPDAKSFAQFKIGSLHEKMNNLQEAIAAYQGAIGNYADTQWARRAEENILAIQGRMRLRQEFEQGGMLPAGTNGDPGTNPPSLFENADNTNTQITDLVKQPETTAVDSLARTPADTTGNGQR